MYCTMIEIVVPWLLPSPCPCSCLCPHQVFCEKGFFEIDDSRAILAAGKAAGLGINFHGKLLFIPLSRMAALDKVVCGITRHR
jgi:hypothetical protein